MTTEKPLCRWCHGFGTVSNQGFVLGIPPFVTCPDCNGTGYMPDGEPPPSCAIPPPTTVNDARPVPEYPGR